MWFKITNFLNIGKDWGVFGWPNDKRPFSSVVLDKGVAENLKKDIIEFLKSSKWYFERGMYEIFYINFLF